MRRFRSTLAVACVLAAAATSSALAACPGADLRPSNANAVKVQRATFCLLNVQRRAHGLSGLRTDARLRLAATAYSRAMVSDRFFDHVSPSGSTPQSRIQATGYLDGARSWSIGENIAWGTGSLGTPRSIVRGWMHSPGHRANILDGRFRDIGIGIAPGVPVALNGAPGGATYTTDFGGRS